MRCPEPSCRQPATPDEVKAALSSASYTKFETLSLQTSLASMSDVVWCPRCEYPATLQDAEGEGESSSGGGGQLALCGRCQFAFCSECRQTWHGLSPCADLASRWRHGNEAERVSANQGSITVHHPPSLRHSTAPPLTEQWTAPCLARRCPGASEALLCALLPAARVTSYAPAAPTKASDCQRHLPTIAWRARQEALRQKHGAKLMEEIQSSEWVASNTKPCPRCNTAVEKNGGCNHITCGTHAPPLACRTDVACSHAHADAYSQSTSGPAPHLSEGSAVAALCYRCRKCQHEWCWLCNSTYSQVGPAPAISSLANLIRHARPFPCALTCPSRRCSPPLAHRSLLVVDRATSRMASANSSRKSSSTKSGSRSMILSSSTLFWTIGRRAA